MSIPKSALDKWLIDNGVSSAYAVNSGLCENFAQDHAHFIPGSEIIGTDNMAGWGSSYPGHIWLRGNGRHYDSEALDGVYEWRDLPIFKRYLTKNK